MSHYARAMRSPALVLLAALVVVGVGCSNELSGKADVVCKEHGTFSIQPTECISGVTEGFEGVAVRDEQNRVLRLIKNTKKGDVVRVNFPGADDKPLNFDKSSCSTFDLKHELQNSTVGEIQNVRGHIKVDCKSAAGTLKASVTFANCH
jgi:hypothetical protein